MPDKYEYVMIVACTMTEIRKGIQSLSDHRWEPAAHLNGFGERYFQPMRRLKQNEP